jgi:sugar phosphate isomerase/epimerase
MSGFPRPFASTTCLDGHEYVETLNAYSEASIERVELGYCPDDVEISEVIETYDFEFVAHNYFLPSEDEFILNLASQDEEIRQRSVSYVCDAVEFCGRHGIELYTFHAGFRADPSLSLEFPDEVEPYAECFDSFVHSLRTVLDRTRELDVDLAVENNVVAERNVIDGEPLVLLCDPGECERLFDRVDTDELGLLLDTGHLTVSATTRGYDPMVFVNEATPYVRALHLHTNDGTRDQHRPAGPDSLPRCIYNDFPDVTTSVEATFQDVSELATYLDGLVR